MADTYNEDDSIAPEHAAAGIGRKVSWLGMLTGFFSSFVSSASPVSAGIVAVGEGLQTADDLAHGDVKKAGKHVIVGSAKAAVVYFDYLTFGGAEVLSLLFTGKFLATNVGNVVGQMLDGADKKKKTTSNVAAVAFPRMQMYAPPPPATPQQIAPYGVQPPPGGWRNYVLSQRGQGVAAPAQAGAAVVPVVSGNPRFASGVEVARAATSNGQSQLGSA